MRIERAFHVGDDGDLRQTGAYLEKLELHVTQSDYPGAVSMARGSYHHHFAINSWRTRPQAVRPVNSTGLIGWDITNADGSICFIGLPDPVTPEAAGPS